MSEQTNYRNNPNSPCAQPFMGRGNKSAKRGWWLKGNNNSNLRTTKKTDK